MTMTMHFDFDDDEADKNEPDLANEACKFFKVSDIYNTDMKDFVSCANCGWELEEHAPIVIKRHNQISVLERALAQAANVQLTLAGLLRELKDDYEKADPS